MSRDEIPPGTLYLLILKTLAVRGKLHGYEIAESIQHHSEDILQVEEGSLYPALQRMLIKGWVTAEWGVTAGNRRARYYTLTPADKNSSASKPPRSSVSWERLRVLSGQPEHLTSAPEEASHELSPKTDWRTEPPLPHDLSSSPTGPGP